MGPGAVELVEIEPQELKFVFELRKQSSCSVRLTNKSDEHVAFKVKTTSPKRYCVRPNAGIILPKSILDFTVTLQAQKVYPLDMQCRDKFLVQNTVVPTGTREEDLKSEIFSKDSGRPIQEIKLRVVFLTPSHSSVLKPINGASKQEHASEACLLNQPSVLEEASAPTEITSGRDSSILQETPSLQGTTLVKDAAIEVTSTRDSSVLLEIPSFNGTTLVKETVTFEETPKDQVQEFSGVENIQPSNASLDLEQLSSKVKYLESQLVEVEKMNALLRDEKSAIAHEREKIYQEMALLRVKHAPTVRVGFPFFFVCFIGLVGIVIGNLLHW